MKKNVLKAIQNTKKVFFFELILKNKSKFAANLYSLPRVVLSLPSLASAG